MHTMLLPLTTAVLWLLVLGAFGCCAGSAALLLLLVCILPHLRITDSVEQHKLLALREDGIQKCSSICCSVDAKFDKLTLLYRRVFMTVTFINCLIFNLRQHTLKQPDFNSVLFTAEAPAAQPLWSNLCVTKQSMHT